MSRITLSLATLLASTALAAMAPAVAARADTVAVSADRMLDVVGGTEVDKPLVLIVDGRIAKVGRQA